MKKILIIYFIVANICFGFIVKKYETYSFKKVKLKKDWGTISVRLLESPTKKVFKVIYGNPYYLEFLITTPRNNFNKFEILDLYVTNKKNIKKNFNIKNLENEFEEFKELGKKEYISFIEVFPFETKYEDQKLTFTIKISSENEVITEEITVDLKLNVKKKLGIPLIENAKDV